MLPADVVQSFLESVRRSPGAVAVSCGDAHLTYQELGQRATNLAAHLQALGVGPETRVGICLERSIEWPVAILGTLLAGGAYVPMDASLPDERIAYQMADSSIAVLLSTTRTAARHVLPAQTALVLLDHPDSFRDASPVVADADAGSLAYVIYTSGTTGRPKGVAIERGSLAFSNAARLARYGTTPGTLLGVYPFSFDSSVAGLFWTLATGGHYVITASGEERDPHAMAAAMVRHAVTHLDCLPSHYATLLDFADDAALAALRVVIVGGEELTRATWALHRRRVPHVAMHNEYGPTEATVWCCAHELGRPEHFGRVPIGTPLPGVGIRVEQADGTLVAPGSAGELLVSGSGLARGYLGDAGLTAERFVLRPAVGAADPPRRYYRTGDIVRVGEDGLLEFLGRADRQVKVNGYRIELGEVEAALTALADVRQGVVAVTGADDHRRLVAYVVLAPGTMLTSTAMRRQLALHLPAHMVPSMLVVLDALPKTANGKVDYHALPDPALPQARRPAASPAERQSPRTAESALLRIWQRHLGADDVKTTDNFFDLGGTSLQAIRAAAEVRESLGQAVDPREFFYRTLAQVAETLEREPR